MKTYWDHTPDERAALSSEQVEALAHIALMEEGVTPPDPLELADETEPKLITNTAYELIHVSDAHYRMPTGICFASMDEAQEFCESSAVIILRRDYGKPEYLQYDAKFAVEVRKLPSAEVIEGNRAAIEAAGKARAKNSALRANHERQMREVEKVTKRLWDDWRQQLERIEERKRVVRRFEEYVAMCDGNEVLARRFLLKIYDSTKVADAIGGRGEMPQVAES